VVPKRLVTLVARNVDCVIARSLLWSWACVDLVLQGWHRYNRADWNSGHLTLPNSWIPYLWAFDMWRFQRPSDAEQWNEAWRARW